MFNILGSRARVMPPTLPKTALNPVTKVYVQPLQLRIGAVTRHALLQQASPSPYFAAGPQSASLQGPSLRDAMYPPGVLGRLPPGVRGRMSLQSFVPGGVGGGGGGPGGGGGGLLPVDPGVDPPYVVDGGGSEITEADLDGDADLEDQIPDGAITGGGSENGLVGPAGLLDVVIGPGGITPSPSPSPDFSDFDVEPGPIDASSAVVDGAVDIDTTIIPDEPVDVEIQYAYKDMVGSVAFLIGSEARQPMDVEVLVSAIYKEWELARTTVRAQLMPLKTKQYVAEFSIVGDVTDLWEDLRSAALSVPLTLDAVVTWRMFRNGISDTRHVNLTLPSA